MVFAMVCSAAAGFGAACSLFWPQSASEGAPIAQINAATAVPQSCSMGSAPRLTALAGALAAHSSGDRHQDWRLGAADPVPLGGTSRPPATVPAVAPPADANADAVATMDFSGTVKLTADGKALRVEEAAEAIVYWRPVEASVVQPPAEPLVMTTRRKVFLPRSLPVLVGSRIRFPNEDPILHNAFSTAAGNAFDTGLYGQSEGEVVTFAQAGLVRVYCNVHQAMVGHILVLDTPHFTRPARNGRFQITLPAGAGELFVWHERATLWRKPMSLDVYSSVDVTLDLSRRRVPAHLNKFGKPYRRGGSDYR